MIIKQLSKILLLISAAINQSIGEKGSLQKFLDKEQASKESPPWVEYKHCRAEKVCADEAKECGNGVKWKEYLATEFNSTRRVDIIDSYSNVSTVLERVDQEELEKYREDTCDLVLVTYDGEEDSGRDLDGIPREGGKNCTIWHTEDQCPWITESEYIAYWGYNHSSFEEEVTESEGCEAKIVGTYPGTGKYPKNCDYGPGWSGARLKTTVEEGRNLIYWASLVKEPSCVVAVTLIDEKAKKSKEIWTTQSDVSFPIEYPKTTCEMKIKIWARKGCFSVNPYNTCKNETESGEESSPTAPTPSTQSTPPTQTGSSPSTTAGISVAIILPVVVIVAVIVVTMLRRKSRLVRHISKENQEFNDMYGTYYEGAEDNVAVDNNPMYNQGGGNGDAVITDENVYYQL